VRGNDDRIGGDETVDCHDPERGEAVDQNVVVPIAHTVNEGFENLFTVLCAF